MTSTDITRTAIYLRISKDDESKNDPGWTPEQGIKRQRDACQQMADRLDWPVVETFTDNDISAYSGATRPGFEALLDRMKRGELDAVIVWHVDRLYRSMKDLERVIELAEAARVQLRTVNSGDLDLSTSAGRMLARILGSVARQESEHHSERRKAANAQRRADGQWNREGYTPFGYTRDGDLIPDQAEALRQAARDVLSGKSLRSICVEWNGRGLLTNLGKEWTNLRLRRVLMNPTYAGLVTYGGKNERKTIIGEGNWTKLWDRDTYHGLVALLTDASRRRAIGFVRQHMLSGIAVCGTCGGKMYAARPQSQAVSYVCRSGGHAARSAEPLNDYVELAALKLLRRSDIHKRLTASEHVDIDALYADRSALEAKKSTLASLFTEGVLDEKGVRAESAKLTARIEGYTRAIVDAVRTSPAASLLADGIDKLQENWDATSADIKGKVVDELMTVTVLPVPRGRLGMVKDLQTGEKIINDDYVTITPH